MSQYSSNQNKAGIAAIFIGAILILLGIEGYAIIAIAIGLLLIPKTRRFIINRIISEETQLRNQNQALRSKRTVARLKHENEQIQQEIDNGTVITVNPFWIMCNTCHIGKKVEPQELADYLTQHMNHQLTTQPLKAVN